MTAPAGGAALFAGGDAAVLVETGERRAPAAKAGTRPAPAAAQVLLPVWGYEFTRQFLDRSLPTLLAPGNLPAVARALPTEFVFLTLKKDEAMIREHPGYRRLAAVCAVRFLAIDDLVMDGNHSTTVTLAYARAVRRTGAKMVDTCFFFLVSDYVIADGSLAAVVARMREGASAVQVGNFQTIEEDAADWLRQQFDARSDHVALKPRELMRWALTCMHPATMANTVNFPAFHNSHTNRLFWRVDPDTLIGRFYLMHMICVRPEIEDFAVGASCDYSFVPEMCPSGNVVTIADSDAYLAIEVQPRRHEAHFLDPGPADPREIAASLSEWTTARHRLNAADTIVFHARELPAALPDAIAEADRFVAEVARGLSAKPQPHRNHPYWRGAVAAFDAALGRRPNEDDWRVMLGESRWSPRVVARRIGGVLLGRAPEVRRGHPRWADFDRVREALRPILADPERKLLTVSAGRSALTEWVEQQAPETVRIPVQRLLRRLPVGEMLPEGFNACLIELTEEDFASAGEIVELVAPLLRADAAILVVAFNRRWSDAPAFFGRAFTAGAAGFARAGLWPERIEFVAASRLRWWLNAACVRLVGAMFRGSALRLPLRGASAVAIGSLALGSNLISTWRAPAGSPRNRVITSVLMRLRASGGGAALDAAGGATCGKAGRDRDPAALSGATREPQYNRLLEVQEQVGLTPLGLMTNQVWHEDPRRLTFILARYKFVAKMLSGTRDVAELGCGDAFGTRIVQQEVGEVTVYDFDPLFIADIERRQSPRWPLEARVHDILDGRLPRRHDAIYSLDVIEHIAAEQEDLYLGNLAGSLTDHGVLIVGSPSLESQAYASPQSKIGHVNCKTGRELKGLLEQYFHTVFLFSMNDEVVHTGFYPMAHYLFALCADPKRERHGR